MFYKSLLERVGEAFLEWFDSKDVLYRRASGLLMFLFLMFYF